MTSERDSEREDGAEVWSDEDAEYDDCVKVDLVVVDAVDLDIVRAFDNSAKSNTELIAPTRVEVMVARVTTEDGRVFDFEYHGDRTIPFGGASPRPYRALLWAELWRRTGGTRMVMDEEIIPVNVAALGKPAMAAYLSAVHELSFQSIAERLDLSANTVKQYLTDFRQGRR